MQRGLKDYLYTKASANGIAFGGAFELSPVCNFACHMCYIRRSRAQLAEEGKQELDVEQWIHMARQLRKAGTVYLLLTGGEPFFYPGFRHLYEELHKMGFLISINTNGSLIDEETVAWLKRFAPERMNITLYGGNRDTYERLCGNASAYDKTTNAIRMLTEARICVTVNVSITPENKDDMEEIITFARDLKLNVNATTYMFPPVRRQREAEDSRLSAEEAGKLSVQKEYYRLSEEGFRNAANYVKDLLKKGETLKERDYWGECGDEQMRCRAGRSAFWISWEGKMTACGMMDFPVVTYPFRDGFVAAWEEIKAKVKRESVISDCIDCTKRDICHPCAARLFAETGDVNRKNEYLCQFCDTEIKEWSKYWEREEG